MFKNQDCKFLTLTLPSLNKNHSSKGPFILHLDGDLVRSLHDRLERLYNEEFKDWEIVLEIGETFILRESGEKLSSRKTEATLTKKGGLTSTALIDINILTKE